MAKLSMKLKQSRPAKFSTRAYTRCRICGRPHSVLRKYGVSFFMLEAGISTEGCLAVLALRMRVSRSAIGSVICICH